MNNVELYADALKNLNEVKHNIITSVASNIKCIAAKPIHIGNYWFYVVNYNGEDMPAYCHQKGYNPKIPRFLPIYGWLGWSDFAECCRIFDLIRERLKNF